LLLQFTKGSQSGGFIPITVRSDGYLDQSIESIVHQDEACGVSVVCQLEATVHQDEACGATLVCQLEAVVHQDEACGATIVCQTNSTTHIDIGSMNVTESNNTGNESSDKPSVAEQFATWAPLVVALVLIGVCALREKVNYGGMALGALLLAYCAIALPFFDDGIRTLLGFISLYLIVLYAFEEKEYFDEVKRRKREESGEQEE
jgi:hypothetical protein